MSDYAARLRNRIVEVEGRDQRLAEEMEAVRENADVKIEARKKSTAFEPMASNLESMGGLEGGATNLALETIVLRTARPVLAIQRDSAVLHFPDAESEVWRERLTNARAVLEAAARASGRIELQNHPRFEWVGTGWLVKGDVLITNRHVALEFGVLKSGTFRPRRFGTRDVDASIDFLEELERTEDNTFKITDILHIEDDDGPDLALLRVEQVTGNPLATHIRLAERPGADGQHIAVIGYPARDGRIPDEDLMESIFGNVYNKKRLAPGEVTGADANTLTHDCSTLGGNSGSVVVDLATGEALGLHYAGRFLEANFAVPADLIADRLSRHSTGSRRRPGRPQSPRREANSAHRERGDAASSLVVSANSLSYSVPIRISVSIGDAAADLNVPTVRASAGVAPDAPSLADDDLQPEAAPEDYADREGYRVDFLGDETVDLPVMRGNRAGDVLAFEIDGRDERVLKYQHFSVIMSRSRRLCLYSAVNIDGKASRRMKRVGWRLDPRIPREAQISRDVYGNEPRFSRGHMTRREDPIWGSVAEATLGNADSMHLTNAVPQMQPFNAGIWLGLEDYALDHAREDDMRISVFTGPFLLKNDPVLYGIRIPRSFWKVIAFIHDETGQLCATGYRMSQEDFLREEEFVFGQHDTAQLPLSTIEQRAGISFGRLADFDPLADIEEALPLPLRDFSQIRFE